MDSTNQGGSEGGEVNRGERAVNRQEEGNEELRKQIIGRESESEIGIDKVQR